MWAASLAEMKVYGMSQIKKSDADMWDKKNDAVKNAKEKATLTLAARVLKAEIFSEEKERIKKEITKYSSRYLISSTVKSHGVDEDGDFKSYHAQVVFKYSIENFRNLLKNKGFTVEDLQRHKVAAFIEVLDASAVKSYSWWRDKSSKVHPVLMPLRAKLTKALKEEGYELLPVRQLRTNSGIKSMAGAMGAQYYVSGSVEIEKSARGGYIVKDGIFNFHEALSQKLVSKVDLKKFGTQLKKEEEMSRGVASVEKTPVPLNASKDLLGKAFVTAAKKMNASENVDHLTQGMAQISFYGVNSPVELKGIKMAFKENLATYVSSLMERRIENGTVTFYARTKLTPARLLTVMNARRAGLGRYRGVLKEDGKTLSFSTRN